MRNFILGFTLGAAVLMSGQTAISPTQIKPPTVPPLSPVVIGITPPATTNSYNPIPPAPNVPSFSDAEVPVGTINGTNLVFSVQFANGNTGKSMILTRNGIVLNNPADYNLVGKTITFVTPATPQTGDILQVWYRY